MDSPPLDDLGQSVDADPHQSHSFRSLLLATPYLPEGLYIREARKRRMARVGRNNLREIVFGGLVGAAAIALVVYSATHSDTRGQNSVTTKVPDVASAGAAVNILPRPDILKLVSPDEAVKENANRPFVPRADTPAARFILKTNSDDRERALTCLTQAVYYEAASEGVDGGRAVAQVVLNRMRHPGYPASVCGVVYEGSERATGCQLTFTCDGSLLRQHVELLWNRSRKIAEEALAGRVFAPVGHATHYHADYVLPYWADSLDKTIQIGRHIFYRLKGVYGDNRSFFQHYAGFEPPIPDPHPPAPTIAAANRAEEQQLAETLIGDDSKGIAKGVEKVAITTSQLLADAKQSTLIIDNHPPASAAQPKKSIASCTADDRSHLTSLSATDMRAGSSSPVC